MTHTTDDSALGGSFGSSASIVTDDNALGGSFGDAGDSQVQTFNNQAAASAAEAAISATNASNSATASSNSATASSDSATASASSAGTSSSEATAAAASAADALVSENNAATSETNAETAETNAAADATVAASSAASASSSATSATSSATSATTSATNAATSATNSSNSATASANSATASASSATAAATAKTNAETAETNAETAESNASTSAATATTKASEAVTSASSASTSASTATTKASEASTSASNASTSESNAATSASGASTSATNASNSATAAASSASSASTSATNASNSASAAATSETNAGNSATAAAGSATTASTAATNAGNSATAAAGSASTASTQASAASTSATNASTSATNASTSATNAATSETNAETAETNAETAETNAAVSATSAAASYDLFDDRFLGAKASAPSTDNDGGALVQGTLYFDTTAQAMKVYGALGWQNAGSSVNGTSARFKYTATNNQTVFSGSDDNSSTLAYDPGFIDVYLSGLHLVNGVDYAATTGTSVTLTSGVATSDILQIVAYGTFSLLNDINADTLNNQPGSYYTGYTDTAIVNLIDSAPATLDTLNELAAALGDDPNYATTTATSIGLRAPIASPTFTGTATIPTADINAGTIDGTVIGGATAAAGTFTALTSTGIDDNASATALTIDSANRLNIGKAAAVTGNPVEIQANAAGGALGIYGRASDSFSYLGFYANGANTEYVSLRASSSNDLTIKTGGTDRLTINSTGLGIGTNAPLYNVDLLASSAVSMIRTNDTTSPTLGLFVNSGSNGVGTISLDNGGHMTFDTGANGAGQVERMRIDSLGNVLVGKSSISNVLGWSEVVQVGGANPAISLDNSSSVQWDIANFGGNFTIWKDGSEKARIDSSGNIQQGTYSDTTIKNFNMRSTKAIFNIAVDGTTDAAGTTLSYSWANGGQGPLKFSDASGERARIDASGNVLVGKSSTNYANAGAELKSDGKVYSTVSGGTSLVLNRKTNDGDIISFYKDNAPVGSIAASGGDILIGTGDTAVRFVDAEDSIVPFNTNGSGRDNAINLGKSSERFKDLYLSGTATIGTNGSEYANNYIRFKSAGAAFIDHLTVSQDINFRVSNASGLDKTPLTLKSDGVAYMPNGVYLGGTGAANKLDDFEVGNWTPVGVNMTVASVVSARYVKVGRQVHVDGWVNITSGSGSGSAAALSGLPFVSESYCTGVTNSSTSNATINNSHCRSQAGGSNVQFLKDNDTVVNAFDIDAGHILFSITYQTA